MISCQTKVLLLIYVCAFIHLCHSQCSPGEYLIESNTCASCPKGSYMSDHNHSKRQCIECSTKTYEHASVRYHCNATHDTDYVCDKGRFNVNGKSMVCQQCRPCPFEAAPCNHTSDAICCPKPNMTLEEKRGASCNINSTHGLFCCLEETSTTSTASRLTDKSTVVTTTTTAKMDQSQTLSSVGDSNIAESSGKFTQSQDGLDVGAINGIFSLAVFIGIVIFACFYCKQQRGKIKKRSNT